MYLLRCDLYKYVYDTVNNKALVSTLACVQKIHGTGSSKGAGHFPKEQYVCVTLDTIQYSTVTLVLACHNVVNVV
jgi:hypothetical protein